MHELGGEPGEDRMVRHVGVIPPPLPPLAWHAAARTPGLHEGNGPTRARTADLTHALTN